MGGETMVKSWNRVFQNVSASATPAIKPDAADQG